MVSVTVYFDKDDIDPSISIHSNLMAVVILYNNFL